MKDVEVEFGKTEKGHEFLKRLKRVKVYGILGLILAIGIVIFNAITHASIWEYTSAVALVIASIVFLVQSDNLKRKALRKFEKEKSKKRK